MDPGSLAGPGRSAGAGHRSRDAARPRIHHRDGAAQAGRDAGQFAGRHGRGRRDARARLSGRKRESRRGGSAAARGSGVRSEAHDPAAVRRGRTAAAHRRGQRVRPADRASHRPTPGDRDPDRPRRQPPPDPDAIADREPGPIGHRRRRRRAARDVADRPAGRAESGGSDGRRRRDHRPLGPRLRPRHLDAGRRPVRSRARAATPADEPARRSEAGRAWRQQSRPAPHPLRHRGRRSCVIARPADRRRPHNPQLREAAATVARLQSRITC